MFSLPPPPGAVEVVQGDPGDVDGYRGLQEQVPDVRIRVGGVHIARDGRLLVRLASWH